MKCPKCGFENENGSLFCNKCGTKLQNVNNEIKSDKEKNYKKLFKDKIMFHINKKCVILVILICLVSGIVYINNPISKYKSNIRNNKRIEAAKLYNDKIKGNSDKENKINLFLKSELLDIVDSFKNEKIDFNNAKEKIHTIKSTGLIVRNVNSAIEKVNNLNNSRIAFKKADEFLKNNDLIDAIKEYKNVIADDKNYEKAKEEINNNGKKYKEQVFKKAQEFSSKKDYDKAVEIFSEALEVFPNDNELISKNETYKKLQQKKIEAEKKQKIEEAKTNQQLVVVSSNVVSDYFNINDEAQVIVKNNTNKVVKKFTIGILMYDSNGYPLKSGIIAGEDELFEGKAESVNIQAGQTFGGGSAWNLYTDYGTVSKLNACVIDVEYYDGSKWTNDYYNYWKKEYLGKPYK